MHNFIPPEWFGDEITEINHEIHEDLGIVTFAEMKENPTAAGYLKNLPPETTILAWNTEIGVIVIEGMHRCAAITKASKDGVDLKFELYVAIADCSRSEIPDFREKK